MVYLMRHGQCGDNETGVLNGWRDTLLTPKGVEQAHLSVQKIKTLGITRIISTPLVRGFLTARIVAEKLKIKRIETHCDLRERNFGHLTGLPINRIEEYTSDILRTKNGGMYFLSGCGAETFPQLIERLTPFYIDLTTNIEIGSTLVVTHGDVMKMLLAIHRKADFKKMLKTRHFKNCEVVPLR